MNLTEAEDIAFEYFTRNGFTVAEWPFLAPSLEWRPRAVVTRQRRQAESKAALIVRENCSSIKEPHNWEPLIETRRQLPTLAIYFIVPELQNLQPLANELQELGIGLYVIKPNKELDRISNDRVPFDDIVMTYAIEPDKPYRNRQNILKVLGHSDGYIWWIDKHFTAAGFDYLYDFFMHYPNRRAISQIRVLGSREVRPPTEINNLRRRLADFNREVAGLGVTAEMRLITDRPTLQALHDRYIISANTAFNVLPTSSLLRGQMGSLTLDDNPPDFRTIWGAATPL